MIIRLAALALVLLGSPALACDRGTVSGRVSHVRDGDTIELGAMAIRLQGLAASLLLTLTTARTAEEPPDLTCVPGYCPSIFQRSTCSGVLLELADEQPTKHAREVYIDLYADVIGPVMDVLLELEEDRRNLIIGGVLLSGLDALAGRARIERAPP